MTKSKHPEILLVPQEMDKVACDGGGALGHPKVWYTFNDHDQVVCRYCDRLFTKTDMKGARPLKGAA